jgi:hypothetical protein
MLSKKYIYNSMKLTIDKFQKLQSIATLETDDLQRATKLVQVLLDKSEDEIDAMPLKKFAKLCKKLQQAFDLKVIKEINTQPKSLISANGKTYSLNFEIKPPFNTGRYIEVLTFSKEDPIMNMHNILASICTPMKWSWRKLNFVKQDYDVLKHEEYAKDLSQADFRHGYHAMVFFCKVLVRSTNNTTDYLEREIAKWLKEKKRVQQWKTISPTTGDGSLAQKK